MVGILHLVSEQKFLRFLGVWGVCWSCFLWGTCVYYWLL